MFIKKIWRLIIFLTLLTTFIFLFHLFVFQWCYVPSESMSHTLCVGDCIGVNKMVYGAKIPRRLSQIPILNSLQWLPGMDDMKKHQVVKRLPAYGHLQRQDVVVFEDPKESSRLLVKRIIALANDTLLLKDGRLFINGEQQQEAPGIIPNDSLTNHWYVIHGADKGWTQGNYGPVKIPEHYFFVLGDNRSNSLDSRFYGFVPEENVIGRVNLVLFAKKDGKWDWQRFLHRIK